MNTATPCIRTTRALSIALVVCATTVATQLSGQSRELSYPQGYDSHARDTLGCAGMKPQPMTLEQGTRQFVPMCNDSARSAAISPSPVRLARPLTDGLYIRSGDSIRYSF